MSSFAKAQTEKLDNLAAAGVVIGNGAVDFYLGDEQSFDVAANIAYSAYLSEVFSGGYQQNDLQVADQILGGNADKIIMPITLKILLQMFMRKLLVVIGCSQKFKNFVENSCDVNLPPRKAIAHEEEFYEPISTINDRYWKTFKFAHFTQFKSQNK